MLWLHTIRTTLKKKIIIQYKFTVLNNDWYLQYLHTIRVTLVSTK